MKNDILIIGTGEDVILKKRGYFINQNFSNIVVCNKTIFHLEAYSDYIGNPTIWGTCGWYDNDDIFDATKKQKKDIFDILRKSNIDCVWCNSILKRKDLDFLIPEYIKYINIVHPHSGFLYHSLGLQSILYALLKKYSNVFYMGIDSYIKSHHYYDEDLPDNILEVVHNQSNYISEYKIIKKLKQENKLKHIDEIF